MTLEETSGQGSPPSGLKSLVQSPWSILVSVLAAGLILAFFYLDRNGVISSVVSSWGWYGIGLSIVLMALICILPLPSEFLLMMDMKVYGVYAGILFAWTGAMLGTFVTFYLARYFGRPLVRRWIPEHRLILVDDWVKRRGAIGLVIVRLMPVPSVVVNYVAGMIVSVRFWPYMWTAAVSIIPYYVATGLLFIGVFQRLTSILVLGGFLALCVGLLSVFMSRRNPSESFRKHR